jgi:hypothetical protein
MRICNFCGSETAHQTVLEFVQKLEAIPRRDATIYFPVAQEKYLPEKKTVEAVYYAPFQGFGTSVQYGTNIKMLVPLVNEIDETNPNLTVTTGLALLKEMDPTLTVFMEVVVL